MKNLNGEYESVKKISKPNTITSLKSDLRNVGVKKSIIVLVHSSLNQLGWTVGGPMAVIQALMDVITSEGTLIMPTFTAYNTEPSRWENPPVPEEWWPIIRKNMPAFDANTSPTRMMGIISETFRKYPNVLRSNHPVSSFAAWGKYANEITADHNLTADLGEGSPLSKIYDLDGHILLLGVSHHNNSSLHLAEYRSEYKSKKYQFTGSALKVGEQREWVKWRELNHNSDDFERLGADFEKEISYKVRKVGIGNARLFSQREIVDFAIHWFEKNRD